MKDDVAGEITLLLQAAKSGQPGALDRLFALVYDELRKIARNRITAGGYWAAETTTVVNEACIRLIKKENLSWEDRHHFFWAAARAIRDILVERARSEQTLRRGRGRKRVQLQDDMTMTFEAPDPIDLNEALIKLEIAHPIPYKIVSLKFFAGLSPDEIAEMLRVSRATVWREWDFARAWLLGEIEGSDDNQE